MKIVIKLERNENMWTRNTTESIVAVYLLPRTTGADSHPAAGSVIPLETEFLGKMSTQRSDSWMRRRTWKCSGRPLHEDSIGAGSGSPGIDFVERGAYESLHLVIWVCCDINSASLRLRGLIEEVMSLQELLWGVGGQGTSLVLCSCSQGP